MTRSIMLGATAATLSLTASAAPAAAAVNFYDGFEGQTVGTSWVDGKVYGQWKSVYNGYGVNSVAIDGSRTLSQSPKPSTSPYETHAGLAVTTVGFQDMDATLRMRTVQQLRTGSAPNPWEVAWVLWHYTDDTHFYYLALKPNGWELGKEDPAYPGAQRYLATGSSPTFPVGPWYTVNVKQVRNVITVSVNGTKLVSFTDKQRPYYNGKFGLYNEDATVHFDDVRIAAP